MEHHEMDGARTALTTGELARRLGTTIPRVHRAVRAGVIVPVGRGARGYLLFAPEAEDALRARWGMTIPVAGRSRAEVFVLAALARRPFGLRSARAVARLAGVSPTVAGRALTTLAQSGLVRQRHLIITEGRTREVDNWSVAWRAPEWWLLAPLIARVRLPESSPRSRARVPVGLPRRLPRRLWHLFWDSHPAGLDPRRHPEYVAARVLEYGDRRALAWLVRTYPPAVLRALGRKPSRLSAEVRGLARALAGDATAAGDAAEGAR
jgi:hypothetical protein